MDGNRQQRRSGWKALACLAVVLAVAACDGDDPTSPPDLPLLSCESGNAPVPEPGSVTRPADAGALCLPGGPGGAEYLYVPFFASDVGTALLALELTGEGIRPPAGSRSPAAVQAAQSSARLRPDEAFHHRLRQRERREVASRLGPAGRASGALRSAVAVPPQVGALVSLNTTTECQSTRRAAGRVMAVSRTAVIVADTSNPAGGFTEEDWEFFAAAMDTLVYPVDVENFGEPTDIDGNGRIVLFFTRAVNELTAPRSDSFVGGFFWAGDLFPREGGSARLPACPGSNSAELMYLLAPDPDGTVNENPRSTAFVRQQTVGVVAHELQHLINAARRIYTVNAMQLEEVWLNEGLSHIAEELLFYRTTGLQPRQNIDLETIRATEHRQRMFVAYAAANFARYERYLRQPDEETLLGIDELPTRGASWAFLRYLADREDGPDAPFFRRLVDGPEAGVRNLANVLGADPLDRMQAWTVSVYTDDYTAGGSVPVPPPYVQPSWNFRSVMAAVSGTGGFPLRVVTLEPGVPRALSLQGGGAAFVRFSVPAGKRATIRAASGGAPAGDRLRVSVVRLR